MRLVHLLICKNHPNSLFGPRTQRSGVSGLPFTPLRCVRGSETLGQVYCRAVHISVCLSMFVLFAVGTSARAALDAESKKPYQIEVVLHIADNRALTQLFQNELARSLGDQLRQTFGALAQIKVVRTHT